MIPLKALLLDVDGVLVIPPVMFGAALTPRSAAQAFFLGPFLSASIGQADLPELLPPLLTALGCVGTPKQFMAEWFAAENHPNIPLLNEVRALRAAGWPVYLATNQERHRLTYLLHDMGLNHFLDGEFASCSVGVRKPEAAYFELVQRELGLLPHQIVFWDDAPSNIEAALAAGWAAYLYKDLEGFTRKMAGLAGLALN